MLKKFYKKKTNMYFLCKFKKYELKDLNLLLVFLVNALPGFFFNTRGIFLVDSPAYFFNSLFFWYILKKKTIKKIVSSSLIPVVLSFF